MKFIIRESLPSFFASALFLAFSMCSAIGDTIYSGTSGAITVADGATITLNGVTITGNTSSAPAIKCSGDATIIIADGTENIVTNKTSGYSGIWVKSGKTITIKGGDLGTGKLKVYGGSGAAAIGSGTYFNNDTSKQCGNIVIESGTIEAIAVSGSNLPVCAGIGSGANGCKCGDITITGGNVTAQGGANGGAGIGGSGGSTSGTTGTITISGGTVKAIASSNSAAIGSGEAASSGKVVIGPNIEKVIAQKGKYATSYIGKGADNSQTPVVEIDSSLVQTEDAANYTLTLTPAAQKGLILIISSNL